MGLTMNLNSLVEPDRVHKTVYTDQQIFELEMEKIQERTWVYCGHESQVPKARATTTRCRSAASR